MSSSPVQPGQKADGIQDAIYRAVIPAASATVAIVPVFYGLIAKSAKQKGSPTPLMKVRDLFQLSLKAAPSVGALVGSQIVAQSYVEKWIEEARGAKDLTSMATAAALVGTLTAPFSAIFNGITLKQSLSHSMRSMSGAQVLAITVRETSFLAAIRISKPLSQELKEQMGEKKSTEIISSFVSGAIGSVIGHPADTYLTRLQCNLQISARDLMRGSMIKAASVGCFTILYNEAKDTFKSI